MARSARCTTIWTLGRKQRRPGIRSTVFQDFTDIFGEFFGFGDIFGGGNAAVAVHSAVPIFGKT